MKTIFPQFKGAAAGAVFYLSGIVAGASLALPSGWVHGVVSAVTLVTFASGDIA
jgi:hypothetical protein